MEKIPEKKYHTKFSCNGCGNSCRDFLVNVSQEDINHITFNNPKLEENNFVLYLDKEDESSFGFKSKYFGKQVKVLKKKTNGECIFLENNLCKINTYKPLVCKLFPLKMNKRGEVTLESSFNKFLLNKCDGSFKGNEIKNNRNTIFNQKRLKKNIENDNLKQSLMNKKFNEKYYNFLKVNLSNTTSNYNNKKKIYEYTCLDKPLTKNYSKKDLFLSKKIIESNFDKLTLFIHSFERSKNYELILNKISILPKDNEFFLVIKNSLNPHFIQSVLKKQAFLKKLTFKERDINYFSLKKINNLLEIYNLKIKKLVRFKLDFSFESKKINQIFSNHYIEYENEKNVYSYIILFGR